MQETSQLKCLFYFWHIGHKATSGAKLMTYLAVLSDLSLSLSRVTNDFFCSPPVECPVLQYVYVRSLIIDLLCSDCKRSASVSAHLSDPQVEFEGIGS